MIGKSRELLRELGVCSGLIYAADQAFQRCSSNLRLYHYDLMVQPIPEKPLLAARYANTYIIREIGPLDSQVRLMPARMDIKEARFKNGAVCLGAFKGNRFIGHIWFSFHSYEEDEVRCTFAIPRGGQAVFDFDLYIFPEFRMGPGFAGIWHGANELLRTKGVRFTFSRIARSNVASRAAHERLGAKRIGAALFFRAWSLQLMVASIQPYFHVSLSDSSRVWFQLSPENC